MTPSFVPPSSLAIARYLLENGELPSGGDVVGRGGFGEVRVVPMGEGSFVAKSAFRAAISGGGAAADALSSKGSWEDASADSAGGFNWTGSGSNGGEGESDAFDLIGAARAGALALGGPPGLANEAAIHARAAAASPDFVMPMTGFLNGQILMPLAKGTLGHHMREEHLDNTRVRNMAEGLADLHTAGIVHRDLKAQNFLVYKELPHLTDFGLARHVQEGEKVKEDKPIGTHTTMAPEVMKNLLYDPKAADVFSFGVLLYQIASHGRLPWEDDQGKPLEVPQQFFALASQSRLPIFDRIADGPYKNLIRRMLSFDPAARPSMREVADDRALQMALPLIVGDAGAGAAQVEPASRAGRDA